MFAKNHRRRFTAMLVLLGWMFSLVVSSAYGCTPYDAAHPENHVVVISPVADTPHVDMHAGDHDSNDPCQPACELQASPVVKEVSGHAPDMAIVALYTSAYIVAFVTPEILQPTKPTNPALLYSHSQALRSTRLSL